MTAVSNRSLPAPSSIVTPSSLDIDDSRTRAQGNTSTLRFDVPQRRVRKQRREVGGREHEIARLRAARERGAQHVREYLRARAGDGRVQRGETQGFPESARGRRTFGDELRDGHVRRAVEIALLQPTEPDDDAEPLVEVTGPLRRAARRAIRTARAGVAHAVAAHSQRRQAARWQATCGPGQPRRRRR